MSKKIIPGAIAVLMVIAMVSCNDLAAPVTEAAEYTADGRQLVTLSIGTGNARALTNDLSKAGTDFYEVTFFDGTSYYRASWDFTTQGKIKIPTGTYDTAAKAVLFAGSMEDKTLLAVGTISNPSGGVIDATTSGITFTMAPLTTDVKADPASSFKITAPTGFETSSLTTANFPKATIGSVSVPLFRLPRNDATIQAEFAITGIDAANAAGIYATSTGIVTSKGISSQSGDWPVVVTGTFTAPTGGAVLADGVLKFGITTPDEDGLSRIALEVPVCAIAPDATTVNPIAWYIRGGLQNALFDGGQRSLGGAILLGVGATANAYPIITAP